jgi:Zn-dependent peptidase ImmA (M78 family)
MFSCITMEEMAVGLDAVAVELLEAAGTVRPPVDALAVARAAGLTVTTDDQQQGRARYVRLRGLRGRASRPTVVLRPEPRPERRHWAVAHEIGEHVAHRILHRLGVDPRTVSPNAREAVANQMAGRLLLPTAWFASDAATEDWDLVALKSRYSTASHELIARRMLELSAPAVISIFDQGRLYFRGSNLPGRVPPPTGDEIRCWKSVHRRNRPHESANPTARIRGWPIHEPGWKREILRFEVTCETAWEGTSPADEGTDSGADA